MSIFTSDRSEQGRKLYGGELSSWDDLLQQVRGSRGQFDDINNLGDIGRRFGVSGDVSGVYRPLRRNLATNLARTRSSIASRLGNSATPEFQFAPAEAGYMGAMGELSAQEAQSGLNQRNYTAQFLKDILEGKQGFGERKLGRLQSGLSGKSGAIGDYLSSLSGSSLFDDILGLVGTGAKTYGAFKGV